MLFLSNQIFITFITLAVVIYALSKSINYSYRFSLTSKFFWFEWRTITKFILLANDFLFSWAPLFKRSSYIGLVWKSNWKL